MPEDCSIQLPQRMDKLHQQVGQLDMRVSNVENQIREEVQRSTTTANELRVTMKDLMQQIKDKNDIKEFFSDNWKYIGVVVLLATGGDAATFIKVLAEASRVL